jgi:hypothetical protein
MDITIQPAQVVTLAEPISLDFVRDNLVDTIIAKVNQLPRPFILWQGADQYAAAGNWTNETALAQATAVLSLSSIPWA